MVLPSPSTSLRSFWLLWGTGILVLVLHHVLAYAGHFGYDDMLYARLAHGLSEGHLPAEEHFSYRWSVVLPTALFYKLFEVNDHTSSLSALLTSMLAIGATLWALRRYKWPVMALGGSLVLLNRWSLAYSDKLMADIHIATAVIVAMLAVAGYRSHRQRTRAAAYALGWVLALFYGFVTKGNILLTLPLWLWLAVEDLWRHRDWRFWAWGALWGAVVLVSYLGVIAWWAGDPLARFSAIAANAYQNVCSYELQPASVLWHRISAGWSLDLLYQGAWPALVLLLACLGRRQATAEQRFWLQSGLILLLAANFMTISLDHYQPMCIDVRHYLYLIPVAAVAFAPHLWDWLWQRKGSWLPALLMSVAAGVALWRDMPSGWWLYVPLASVLWLRQVLPLRPGLGWGIAALWLMALSAFPLHESAYVRKVNYAHRRDLVIPHLPQLDPSIPVLTDEVWGNMGPYYQGFPAKLSPYYSFEALDTFALEPPFYLLLDGHTQYFSGISYEALPVFARQPPEDATFLLNDQETQIRLLRIDSLHTLQSLGRADLPSGAAQELSIHLSLDSLQAARGRTLVLRTRFQGQWQQRGDVRLGIYLHNASGLVASRETPFGRQLKALTTWWPVRLETTFPPQAWEEATVVEVRIVQEPETEVALDGGYVEVLQW